MNNHLIPKVPAYISPPKIEKLPNGLNYNQVVPLINHVTLHNPQYSQNPQKIQVQLPHHNLHNPHQNDFVNFMTNQGNELNPHLKTNI